ncbi:hypothetical protein [Roseateles violae]|uniref:Uncharacterized protein n=1 Tax=Roseateles violae TaxID=3058042 RepID=A0ABT8DLE7_9BURK|nr:hypothetical protein [Pelomonas sp. PFR6]MDN3918723.1 hypothetical protein [Pelomonas sp. PFR6]
MQPLFTPIQAPIRTVLHLSAATATAALLQAQRQQQPLGEWLESLVVQGCSRLDEQRLADRLSELMTVELFAHVASNCPGALTGRWKLLFERCLQESALWHYPQVSLEDAEVGVDCQPSLNARALLKRWPQLMSSVWLV